MKNILLLLLIFYTACKNVRESDVNKKINIELDKIISISNSINSEKKLIEFENMYAVFKNNYSDSLLNKHNIKNTKILNSIKKIKKLEYITLIDKQGAFTNKGEKVTEIFYGLKKDSIRINFNSDKRIKSIKIIEEQSGRLLKKMSKTDFEYTFKVLFDNPFSVTIEFIEEAYYNLKIERQSYSTENKFAICEIKIDTVESNIKKSGYQSASRLEFEKVFNEPKKFVVSKTFTMSGQSKVYAPIDLPKNTKEFIYTLRISGNEKKLTEDGTLYNQTSESYRKVKSLGVPIWDSESNSTSITREILNNIFRPTEDKYALNVFFFDKEKEIKKFINYNGTDYKSAFAYDIRNSAISTESRIGLIKIPRSGYSYIGLETTSTFSDTYAWLDAVALFESKYYFKINKKLIRK